VNALRFTWKRFFTFNIDDTVVNVPLKSRAQNLNFFNGLSSRREEWRSFSDLQVVFLHGKADQLESGLVFSETDYATQSAFGKPWYERLGEDFAEFTVLFVGSSLDEQLFRQHAASFRPISGFSGESYLVTPSDLSEIDKASLAEEGIRHLQLSADELFDTLLLEFPGGISPSTVLQATALPNDGSSSLADLERLRSFALIDTERLNKFVIENEKDVQKFRGLFFEGFGPNWSVIIRNEIAQLESYGTLERRILDEIHKQALVVVSGEAGCGKSTFGQWVAIQLSQKASTTVYHYVPKEAPLLDSLAALSRYTKDREVIVLVDDLYLYANEIRDFLLEPKFKYIHILATVRTGEWASRIGVTLEGRVKRLEMPRFSRSDVGRLINKIDNFYPAPQFSRLSYDQKVQRFNKSDKQLLIALKEATFGAGFDEIIESEVRNVTDPLAREILLIAAICTIPRTGLSQAAASSVLRGAGSRASLTAALQNLSGIVEIDQAGRLKARHEIYARHVVEKFIEIGEYERALIKLIGYFSQFEMPVIRSVNQVDGRLFRFLLNNKNIYDAYHRYGDDDRSLRIFERFEVDLQQDGHFWLQYALLLRRLRKQKSALEKLVKSLQAYPGNLFAEHALAQQKLVVATFADSWGAREEKMVSEAVDSLMTMHLNSVANKTVRFDDYPIVTLAYYHVNALVKHRFHDLAAKEAKRYFKIIEALPGSAGANLDDIKKDLVMFVTNGKWVRLELKKGALSMEKRRG